MAKLARLPSFDRNAAEATESRVPRLRTRYYAFLSYSHRDKELADWLHRELEKFRVPHTIVGKLTANGVVPRRLTPVFRDQHDLAAGDDLAVEVQAALAASQFLVVLCSPIAAKSRWMNLEIESFKRTRPEGCVLAAVAAGEPFASEIRGCEAEECFPAALRYKYDRRGHRTDKLADPLAADFRKVGEGRRLAFLKLVAGMLGVGLDELVKRDTTRRQRHLAVLAAGSIAGMAVTSTLAVAALQGRNEARDQRREAETLVAFMVGDLKDRLEPIGRLDALDGVGARVLAYYSKQNTGELPDAALTQRSKALSLMAEVATKRGDPDGALRLYRSAMAGTAEAIRRKADDPQRLFDHAQNVFYIGEIAHERGQFKTAETYMREYKRLAARMIALGPDNMKWRMEGQYADTNLAIALSDQRRYAEAVAQYAEALKTMEAISTADPTNNDYQQGLAELLAWQGDAQAATGDFRGAIASRQNDIAILERLLARTGDVNYQQRLIPAHRMLGVLYLEQGRTDLAAQQLRAAVNQAELLVPAEPNNRMWLEYSYRARLELAAQLLISGNKDEASALVSSACQTVGDLLRHDSTKPEWRAGLARCWKLKSKLAEADGANDQALSFAQSALSAARTVHSGDAMADAYLVADSYRLVGDAQRSLGDADAARKSCETALAQVPAGVAEPSQMAEHAAILERLGRVAEARPLKARLAAMGYRLPV